MIEGFKSSNENQYFSSYKYFTPSTFLPTPCYAKQRFCNYFPDFDYYLWVDSQQGRGGGGDMATGSDSFKQPYALVAQYILKVNNF
jgi:hypothetical protein